MKLRASRTLSLLTACGRRLPIDSSLHEQDFGRGSSNDERSSALHQTIAVAEP